MATMVRERARRAKPRHRPEEQLLLEAASLHRRTDWERLMEQGTTPALVIGGERRLRRKRLKG
jgi:hypothetical protein